MKSTQSALACLFAGAAVMFGCSEVGSGGTGGAGGGAAGTGGAGGGAALTCVEATSRCVNGEIDPVTKNDSCQVDEPPQLSEACDGTERLERPIRCSQTGGTITYQLASIEVDGDCNSGYDLDGCDGRSCKQGPNAPLEGMNGVDNGLTGLAGLVQSLGANLGAVSQAYYRALCNGDIDFQFIVDDNPKENCATVTPVVNGEASEAVAVNVSDDGCMAGNLGNLSIDFGGQKRLLRNVRARLTFSEDGFANGKLGATLDQTTAASFAAALIGVGADQLVSSVLDINDDLEGDPGKNCTALSLTLKIGGVALPP